VAGSPGKLSGRLDVLAHGWLRVSHCLTVSRCDALTFSSVCVCVCQLCLHDSLSLCVCVHASCALLPAPLSSPCACTRTLSVDFQSDQQECGSDLPALVGLWYVLALLSSAGARAGGTLRAVRDPRCTLLLLGHPSHSASPLPFSHAFHFPLLCAHGTQMPG
jgi:hypothetical protein